MNEPRFLTLDEVRYLHDESLARFGGPAGVRELGQVESALGSAQNAYWHGHGGVYEIAAASVIVFLRLNGVRFPEDDGSVYAAMIEIAEKRLDKAGLAAVLRKLVESEK